MNLLPEDIINYIYDFIPLNVLCYLSATNYRRYNKEHLDYLNNTIYGHHLKLNKKYTFDTYVRDLIKNNYYYIFEFVLKDNIKKWKALKKKRYKNFNYKSKLLFYTFYCMECKSNKCLEKIKDFV
jgi:hypothetical protein|tara:strand:- start:753 stop:1127 length:375 start_codon:yes stop_codon:yes gene_type:complete